MSTGGLELVLGLDEWQLTLVDGTLLQVWAVGYHRAGGKIVFSALVKGVPNYEIAILAIDEVVVAQVRGG